MPEYVDAWVAGWVHSRGVGPPARDRGAWYVRTGTSKESQRWVLPSPTPQGLADVLELAALERSCVKLPGDPAHWLPRFGPGWEPDTAGWLLTSPTARAIERSLPSGYSVEQTVTDQLLVVQVVAPDSTVAASGRAGLAGTWSVPDQIVTEPAHQRRGLGSVVMGRLGVLARDAGATHAVLGATDEGKALYERLGWRCLDGLVGAYLVTRN